MAIAVARPYACPICRESFTKWGLCLSHVRSSVPCRGALGGSLQDVDTLQENCRNAASTGTADGAGGAPVGDGLAAATTAQVLGDHSTSTASTGSDNRRSLDAAAVRLLMKAVRRGILTQADIAQLRGDTELRACSETAQVAAVQKFLSPDLTVFRWITDKKAWLQRCITFCSKTIRSDRSTGSNTSLVDALADQALLPNSLPQMHWDRFLGLPAEVQQFVVRAVRCSILVNAAGGVADFFEHVCYNERAICLRSMAQQPPRDLSVPQVEWQAVDGRPYQKLMRHMVFTRGTEERVLKELVDLSLEVAPGAEGSLLHDHLATADARRQGTAEVLSLLHAAANCGLVRVCARFLAEGLDVNERTGQSGKAPLHLAVAHGDCQVISLLLGHRADPNLPDNDGFTPLYIGIQTAAELKKESMGGEQQSSSDITATHHRLQFKACRMLLEAGANAGHLDEPSEEDDNGEEEEEPRTPISLALRHGLMDLCNLCSLHNQIRDLRLRHPTVDSHAVSDLLRLRYETACLVLALFERVAPSHPDAVPQELRAIIASEFVQDRDRIQLSGNRLASRLQALKEREIAGLAQLPPDAAKLVLQLFRVEEVTPGAYEPSAAPITMVGDGDDAAADGAGDGIADAADGAAEVAADSQPTEPMFEGRVRKWDDERGFGFIVQDTVDGVEGLKDIFVHRKRILGNGMPKHIFLRENCRIRFRLAEKDGRPQAMDVVMLDSAGNPAAIHGDTTRGDDDDEKSADELEDGRMTEASTRKQFLRLLRRPDVKNVANEKRHETLSWLKCMGLRGPANARRDDALWRREIERRIDFFLEKGTTPLHKKDFDFRVRRFLFEIGVANSVVRVSEALAMVQTTTAGKGRDDVRSWPAYLATLLRRFDPALHETMNERQKKSRQDDKEDKRHSDRDSGDEPMKNGNGATCGGGAGGRPAGSGSSRRSSSSNSRRSSASSRAASVKAGDEADEAEPPPVRRAFQ